MAFDLSGNAWRLAAGHHLKLEIAGADWPYLQVNRLASTTTLGPVELVLPVLEAADPDGVPAGGRDGAPVAPREDRGVIPATGGGAAALGIFAVLALLLLRRRRNS